MGYIKRCEICKAFLNCLVYDKACEELSFLKNFLDLEIAQEIAQYCKYYDVI